MRRWALVGGVVALVLLAGVLAFAVLLSNEGCARLGLARVDAAEGAVPLDEARVRAEAPQLAALLDRAVDEGEASEARERSARAMWTYLQERGASNGGTVAWRGVGLRATMMVC